MAPPSNLEALREWHRRLVDLNRSKVGEYRGYRFETKARWHEEAVRTLDKALWVLREVLADTKDD